MAEDRAPGGVVPAGRSGRSREVAVHLLAAVVGPALAVVLLGSVTLGVVWRTSALTVAFSLVVVGLSIVAMAVRAEWRRQPVEGRLTGRALLRLAVAFVLVVLATS